MPFQELDEIQLLELAKIDQAVNLTPWSLHSFNESYYDPQHKIIGIFGSEQQLIGGCVYSLILDEAEILQLCIAQAYQGQGYARKLLTAITQELRELKVNTLFLEVRENNLAALRLYQTLGFNQIGCRKNYYKIAEQRINAHVMAKQL